MSFTTPETPRVVAPFWESLLTGLAVGVVTGMGVGVVASSKDVIPTLAAGAAGAGAGSAIAYFVADYQHTHRRNALAAQLNQAIVDRAQYQQELVESRAAAIQLEGELQVAVAKYDQLAEAADTEVQRLQALFPADAVSTDTPTDPPKGGAAITLPVDTPTEPIVPAGVVPELPATAEPATVS